MLRNLAVMVACIGLAVISQSLAISHLSGAGGDTLVVDYKNKPDEFWKHHLKPKVYNICRQKGTELAGSGKYDHFYEKGTYYCGCCGGDHPLFSSDTKFNSGTGWPSFWAPISPTSVTEKEDRDGPIGMFYVRTEVVCSRCGGHLGHVFQDGPKEHTGLRYCMNSAALTFLPQGQKPEHILEKDSPEKEPKP